MVSSVRQRKYQAGERNIFVQTVLTFVLPMDKIYAVWCTLTWFGPGGVS
jgi:hypothetical protein